MDSLNCNQRATALKFSIKEETTLYSNMANVKKSCTQNQQTEVLDALTDLYENQNKQTPSPHAPHSAHVQMKHMTAASTTTEVQNTSALS
jgi:hypothetical protein